MAINKGSYVIVQAGDTLSEIVEDYVKTGEDLWSVKIPRIAKLNDIDDVDKIVVGQKIKLVADSSTTTAKKDTSYKVQIKAFGLVSKNSTRQVYVSWKFNHKNVDHYKVDWVYATGVGEGFVSSSTVNGDVVKQALYTAPEEATKVKVKITPVSKTYKQKTKNGKEVETPYWKGTSVTSDLYYFKNNPPQKMGVPEVTMENLQLTASVSNVEDGVDIIHFELHQGDAKNGFLRKGSQKVTVDSTRSASWVKTVWSGSEYKIRCRGIKSVNDIQGEWSDFSPAYATAPATPAGFTKCAALNGDGDNKDKVIGVNLAWTEVPTAKSYTIEYSTDKSLLGVSETTKVDVEGTERTISLEPGAEYFFRIKAKNGDLESDWSEISSAKVGEKPAAPTTWSSTSTVTTGEDVILYWVHNSENEPTPTESRLIVRNADGGPTIVDETIKYTSTLKNETCTKNLKVSGYPSGTTLLWKVCTKGVSDTYGDWSTERAIRIYDAPILETELLKDKTTSALRTEYHVVEDSGIINDTGDHVYISTGDMLTYVPTGTITSGSVTDTGKTVYTATDKNSNVTFHYCEVEVSKITSFPFYIRAEETTESDVAPKPIGYHVSVVSNEYYETTDASGVIKMVNPGSVVYTKFVDDFVYNADRSILVEFSAGNIDLENAISYTIICTVSMDSGLSGTQTCDFVVDWQDEVYTPNATVTINEDDYSALIKPFCEDENGDLVNNVTLSVFRREYDGTFVCLAQNMSNVNNAHVVDPHPGLDYARYRIVAVDKTTGAMNYYDLPGVYIGGYELVVQWDEQWKTLETEHEGEATFTDEPAWTGSLLKLPYNLDVSDSYNPDVELVEYIGRSHPVSYYGTQVGETRNVNFDIIKDDTETLYALRRLAIWMGNAYVREPSGSGYWASISVSFNKNHNELVIPVTLKISRVEGGV